MTDKPAPPIARATTALMASPYFLLVLCSLIWGGNTVAGKLAVGNVDPYLLMILRWAGAFLLVLPFAIAPLRRDWRKIVAKWWLYLFYGAVGFGTFNALVYIAAHHTTGFNLGLDQVTINIFVMALSFAFFRTRVRALQLVGVAITIVGVALTASHGDLSRLLALDINFGDWLMFAASFAYAAYSITLRWRPQTDWRSFLAVTFLGATLASVVFAASAPGSLAAAAAAIPQTTPLGWAIAAYAITLPSIVAQMFYVRGVEMIGPNRASLFINLIPLFGALGAVLILGEILEAYHFTAAGLVITGIVLAEWSARRA